MATTDQRLKTLEDDLKRLRGQVSGSIVVGGALQQTPGDATLALPHMDTWLFEDNVDATHPANLRYVVASITRQIVSARLSIKLSAYRTYNSLALTATGATTPSADASGSSGHSHSHGHSLHIVTGASGANLAGLGSGGNISDNTAGSAYDTTTLANANAAAESGHSHSHTHGSHTHTVSGTATLGVTEGATATGVTITFDGVDQTAALGGPFNADVVELDVRRFLATSTGLWHVIAMQPSGLGRIEAHLRLGVYVAAGQVA